MTRALLAGAGLLAAAAAAAAAEIPDLLTTAAGRRVDSAAAWERERRPELLELFRTHVYGRNPVERPAAPRVETLDPGTAMMAGRALRKRVALHVAGPGGSCAIRVTAFIPASPRPAPAFLLICNRPETNIDPDRVQQSPFWPAEALVARGYAALAFHNGDVDPDRHDGFTNGVHGVFQPDPAARGPDAWGTLAAWAWGASRVMDWIETEPLLDASRVAVVGHSRGGKTALWCGATDPRFALTVSNDSGCGGAKLHRAALPKSESIARITQAFPHWFCHTFSRYAGREAELPVDQHQLLALLAPRLAYVASASLDDWAGPPGEFRSCQLASPAWRLYGHDGLAGDAFPPPGAPLHAGRVGYHLRAGKHDLTLYDWERFMDFADRHWRAP